MARKIYKEDKMKELISRKGDGEYVPEGSTIFYNPDSIEVDNPDGSITKFPNIGPDPEVKAIIKRVSGKPIPKTGGDPGNIKSKENTNFQFRGTDVEYLREQRKKQAKAMEKAEKEKKERIEDFREKEKEGLKKKKFSEGGMVYGKSFKGIF